jgi:hypothetical protein
VYYAIERTPAMTGPISLHPPAQPDSGSGNAGQAAAIFVAGTGERRSTSSLPMKKRLEVLNFEALLPLQG